VIAFDGHSDYGRALLTFHEHYADAVTGARRSSSLATLATTTTRRTPRSSPTFATAPRPYWLNPEPTSYWNSGDSIVNQYAPYCDRVIECRTLRQLEAFVGSWREGDAEPAAGLSHPRRRAEGRSARAHPSRRAYCNARGVVGGPVGCGGLTERGRAQAAALSERLSMSREFDDAVALYTSVLPRSIETAQLIAEGLPEGLAAIEDCDLCELHPGESDGMTWDEMVAAFGGPNWDEDPDEPSRLGASRGWASTSAAGACS